MSDKINDGGQAFPNPDTSRMHGCPGMTLRDWLAANASEADIEHHRLRTLTYSEDGRHSWFENRRTREQARFSFADAMIAARNEKEVPSE